MMAANYPIFRWWTGQLTVSANGQECYLLLARNREQATDL